MKLLMKCLISWLSSIEAASQQHSLKMNESILLLLLPLTEPWSIYILLGQHRCKKIQCTSRWWKCHDNIGTKDQPIENQHSNSWGILRCNSWKRTTWCFVHKMRFMKFDSCTILCMSYVLQRNDGITYGNHVVTNHVCTWAWVGHGKLIDWNVLDWCNIEFWLKECFYQPNPHVAVWNIAEPCLL